MRLIDTDKIKFPNIAVFDMKLHGTMVPMVRVLDLKELMPAVDAVPLDKVCAILAETYTTPLCWKCEKALGEEYCIEKECGCGSKEHWKAYFEKMMEASKNDAE